MPHLHRKIDKMLVNQHFRTPLNGYIYWYEDEVHPTSLNAPEKNLNFENISPSLMYLELRR